MNSGPEMELKIIEAAIACIEKYGFQEATVRRIAQEAGVNVAAINYYFRSKEHLMERVMQVTLGNAFDWTHFKESEEYPPKERLVAILDHLTAGAQAYPEMSRAHFIAPLIEKDYGSAAYVKFNEFLEKLYGDLMARGAEPDPWQLRMAVMQAVTASIIGLGLFPDLLSGFAGKDLRDPGIRRQYIESLVNKILSQE
jgi:AcrR family transcriptional regulator